MKEKQAELTACLGMVPRDQGKALSLEAELNDLVRRCNDLGTEYEAIQKEYAEKTGVRSA